jgi:glycosyltransferase involved in cell wall biosynthesis
MIIAIDGYEANTGLRVGIGRYAFEIITGIYRLVCAGGKYPGLKFRIYLPGPRTPHWPESTDFWQYSTASPSRLWTFIGLPVALYRDRPEADVIFSPTHYIPRFTYIPTVCAVMDLSYVYFPEYFRKQDLYKLKNWTEYSVKHAQKILTISRNSRDAIIKTYKVNEKSVVVTYPGLTDMESKKIMSKTELSDKYRISSNYILSVGTLQPRKNYGRLIEAFAMFLKKNRQQFSNLQLVIIGKKGWLYDEILAAPEKHGITGSVRFLDFVPDPDLPSFYRNALAFTLPSLYEGFGLPVLEAMASGCPVVVSKTSSIPEIAGRAGVYVDPANSESIAEGLLTAVRQRNLIQGKFRIRIGKERAAEFTWDKAARQTLEVLTDVVRKGKA